MANIYISNSTNPYKNISSEYSLFMNSDEDALYLWVNQPCVILGKNQCSSIEFNHDFIKKNNILPVRRMTGGGCVYHDLGNLNFTFISKSLDKNLFLSIIINALKTFDINAIQSGRNDLLVDGYKVSGTAYLYENDHYLFHGTLMVDVNMENLYEAITPHIKKLENNGISSVRSRVKNLSEFCDTITVNRLKEAIIKEYLLLFPNSKELNVPQNNSLTVKLMDKEWIYNQSNDNKIMLETIVNHSLITLYLEIKDDYIKYADIYTDSLDTNLSEKIKDKIINKPYHHLNDILNRIQF